jgi:hypothetical protein
MREEIIRVMMQADGGQMIREVYREHALPLEPLRQIVEAQRAIFQAGLWIG